MRRSRGVALISVLVVLAVATTLVSGLLLTLQLDLRRLETAARLRQARAWPTAARHGLRRLPCWKLSSGHCA